MVLQHKALHLRMGAVSSGPLGQTQGFRTATQICPHRDGAGKKRRCCSGEFRRGRPGRTPAGRFACQSDVPSGGSIRHHRTYGRSNLQVSQPGSEWSRNVSLLLRREHPTTHGYPQAAGSRACLLPPNGSLGDSRPLAYDGSSRSALFAGTWQVRFTRQSPPGLRRCGRRPPHGGIRCWCRCRARKTKTARSGVSRSLSAWVRRPGAHPVPPS